MATKLPDQSKWYIPAASLFLYLTACTLPCLELFSNGTVLIFYGYSILLQGWTVILAGQLAWLANPAWLTSMIFFIFRRWALSVSFSALSIVLASGTFLLYHKKVAVPDPPDSQRGIELSGLRIGFYVWMTSLIVIGAGALYEKLVEKRAR